MKEDDRNGADIFLYHLPQMKSDGVQVFYRTHHNENWALPSLWTIFTWHKFELDSMPLHKNEVSGLSGTLTSQQNSGLHF